MHPRQLIATCVLLAGAAACTDELPNTLHPTTPSLTSASATASTQDVPARSQDPHSPWSRRSDDTLWYALSHSDSIATVGLKSPGTARGAFQDRILFAHGDAEQAARGIFNSRELELVRMLPTLPIAVVKIRSLAALTKLRRLPMVDYVQPTTVYANQAAFGGPFESGCSAPDEWRDYTYRSDLGDIIPWSYTWNYHNIVDAWKRAQGDNIRVAILDTGLDPMQEQFFGRFNWNPGASRTLWTFDTTPSSMSPSWSDDCGHGTRVNGLIGAPMDGTNTVGIAWKSDIISIRVTPDVIIWWSGVDVYQGIGDAVNNGAKVIQMAFGIAGGDASVADLIRYYYYQTSGPLFVAAIGNTGDPNAAFPAEMDEVIAVVAGNQDGSRNGWSSWGPSSELEAFTPTASVGVPSRFLNAGPVSISMTSAASATISGIAALVWSVHPTWTNKQVRDRLRAASAHPLSRNWQNGYGFVDAYKAVGGMKYFQIAGAACGTPGEEVPLTAWPDGDGPYAYRWGNGSTSNSILLTASTVVGGVVAADVEATDLISGQRFTAYHEVVTTLSESGDCTAPGGQ